MEKIPVVVLCPPGQGPPEECVRPAGGGRLGEVCAEAHRLAAADPRQEPLVRAWREHCLRATMTAVVWYLRVTPQRLLQLLRECRLEEVRGFMYIVGARGFWRELGVAEAVELLCTYVRAGVAVGHDKISRWALRKWEEACQSDEIMRSIRETLSARPCPAK